VNLLIERVNDTIRALKPWVKFGVSPTGIYRNSTNPAIGTPTSGLEHYTTLYCDSRKWLQQGWIDYLAPQVYWYIGQPGADYGKIVPWWNDNANGRHIYIGMAGYKVNDPAMGAAWANPSMIPNEVRVNRSYTNVKGQGIYNTSSLRSTTKLGFRDSLRLFFYNKPALLPLMPWKDDASPQPATALSAVKYGNDSVVLNWIKPAATANELDKAKRFVIYRSANPVIDINDANNILFITPFDTTAYKDNTVSPNTTYYYTVTAIDRLHNESEVSNTASNTPPTITCPGNQQLDLTGSCTIALPDYTGMAIVNNNQPSASPIVVTQTPAAGTVIIGATGVTVTLTATDKAGNTAACNFEVYTHDVTPPVITTASVTPNELYPPNHKMKMVMLSYKVEDNCGAMTSLSVTSNEPVSPEGDWEVIDGGHVKLRAERDGNGTGRIYTITITATDAAGNTTSTPVTVLVPHDNSAVTHKTEPTSITEAVFVIEILGNPTNNHFTITPRSGMAAPVTMVVMDNLGRIVERRTGITPNSTIQVGNKYPAGIYFAEFRQGENRNYVKLVKK
jgi:fibronectin type 3 domain-containing protein